MPSLKQNLDYLADLFLTTPDRGVQDSASHRRTGTGGLPRSQPRPLRIAPQYNATEQHREPTVFEPYRFMPAHDNPDATSLEQTICDAINDPKPLQVQYPNDKFVRLIVDGAGRIHIWRERNESNIHDGIVCLINARFWVLQNITLIALSEPSCRFDLNAEPELHVLTCDSKKASLLDGALGPCIKIHVQQAPRTHVRHGRYVERHPA